MDKLKKWIQENKQKTEADAPDAACWESIRSVIESTADPLRVHIQKFKSELEVDNPQNWENIRAHILAKQSVNVRMIRRRRYLVAACIILLTGVGFTWYLSTTQSKSDGSNAVVPRVNHQMNQVSKDTATEGLNKKPERLPNTALVQPASPTGHKKTRETRVTSIAKIKTVSLPPELLQIQEDYDKLITSQISYTKSLPVYGENASYFYEFMVDLRLLDEQEKQLRSFILTNTSDQNKIFELAMIYEQKLTVLKKLQNEINKTSIRNRNEKDTLPVYLSL